MQRFLLAVLLFGCGSNDPSTDDAGSSSDGDVTLVVSGAHAVDVAVIFQAPDSTILAQRETDANGTATGPMIDGGFVTAIDPFGGATGTHAYTFTDVQAGASLALRPSSTEVQVETHTTLVIPRSTDPSITRYAARAHSPCNVLLTETSRAATTVTFEMAVYNCVPSELLVIAYSATGASEWLFADGLAIAAPVDLTTHAFAPTVTHDVTYTNVLPTLGGFRVSYGLEIASGIMGIDSVMVPTDNMVTTSPVAFRVPNIPGATAKVVALFDSYNSIQTFYNRAPIAAATWDLGARSLGISGCPQFDPDTRVVSWTRSGTETPDFATGQLSVGAGSWSFLAPNTGTAVTLPALPGVLSVDDSARIEDLTFGRVAGGVDAIRAYGNWPRSDNGALYGFAEAESSTVKFCN